MVLVLSVRTGTPQTEISVQQQAQAMLDNLKSGGEIKKVVKSSEDFFSLVVYFKQLEIIDLSNFLN